MLNLVWMIVVGALIGVVASMFVPGARTRGLGWTVFLGGLGYGLGGWTVMSFHGSVLNQWLLGIAVTALLLTGYLLMTSKRH